MGYWDFISRYICNYVGGQPFTSNLECMSLWNNHTPKSSFICINSHENEHTYTRAHTRINNHAVYIFKIGNTQIWSMYTCNVDKVRNRFIKGISKTQFKAKRMINRFLRLLYSETQSRKERGLFYTLQAWQLGYNIERIWIYKFSTRYITKLSSKQNYPWT